MKEKSPLSLNPEPSIVQMFSQPTQPTGEWRSLSSGQLEVLKAWLASPGHQPSEINGSLLKRSARQVLQRSYRVPCHPSRCQATAQ